MTPDDLKKAAETCNELSAELLPSGVSDFVDHHGYGQIFNKIMVLRQAAAILNEESKK